MSHNRNLFQKICCAAAVPLALLLCVFTSACTGEEAEILPQETVPVNQPQLSADAPDEGEQENVKTIAMGRTVESAYVELPSSSYANGGLFLCARTHR